MADVVSGSRNHCRLPDAPPHPESRQFPSCFPSVRKAILVLVNLHHLELFYYVARHGGIMEAVRNMPYGIQQPAVSGQILQLEADLGLKLFNRRPFELTPAGQDLYAFVQPFFSQIEVVGERLRGGTVHSLRLAAPVFALREHLPDLLQNLRARFPDIRLTLREAHQPEIVGLLERQEIDCAVTVIEGALSPQLQSEPLVALNSWFLVPRNHRAKTADELLDGVAAGTERLPLIALPANEAQPRRFRELTSKRGLEWTPSIEVTGLELIDTYVTNGFGIGLSLEIPGKRPPAGVRALRITDLPPLIIGTLWREPASASVEVLRSVLQARAAQLNAAAAAANATTPGT